MSQQTFPKLRVRFHVDHASVCNSAFQQRVQSVVVARKILIEHSRHQSSYRFNRSVSTLKSSSNGLLRAKFHSLAKEGWLRPSMKCRAATLAGRRRGSCEKIGIKRYSPPCGGAAVVQGGE